MDTSNLCAISLNTWADCTGKVVADIVRLASDKKADVIFLQEVHDAPPCTPRYVWPKDPGKRTGPINAHLFSDLSQALSDAYVGYFAPQMHGYLHDTEVSDQPLLAYGNATFVRIGLKHAYRDAFIYGHAGKKFDDPSGTPVGKTGQAVDVFDSKGKVTFAHAHGAWYKSDKRSNFKWRKEQVRGIERLINPNFEAITELVKHEYYQPRVVLLGDLNVVTLSKTVKQLKESKVFGKAGGIHLNSHFGLWRTRTEHYTGEEWEADHAFASPGLNATLEVDLDVASDHGALIGRVAP